jgi:hypothetical protein
VLDATSVARPGPDAEDPAIGAVHQVRHRDPEAKGGAGLGGGVHQDGVEDGAARGVEGVDAAGALDRHGHLLGAVVEGGLADRGRPGRHDPVEQAPAVELDHATAHEGMGGERVAPVGGAVEDEHPQARAGQEQGGGGAAAAGADDDDVVVGGGHGWLRCARAGWVGTVPVSRAESSAASWRAPSTKLELRLVWKRSPAV